MISLQSAFQEKGGFNLAILTKKKKENDNVSVPVLASNGSMTYRPFSLIDEYTPSKYMQYDLYDSLREAIPVIDAAIYKLVRLTGGFKVKTEDKSFDKILDEFNDFIFEKTSKISLDDIKSAKNNEEKVTRIASPYTKIKHTRYDLAPVVLLIAFLLFISLVVYIILKVSHTDKVLDGQEEKIIKAVDMQLAIALFEFMDTEYYNQVRTGEYYGGAEK